MAYVVTGNKGDWEVVIGLEVHAQVVSNAKLFSGAPTAFGAEPNAQVTFIDAAMPGMLPVINAFCVEQAVKTGLGLKARINRTSVFARKNYFYADLPQGYQISQYDQPIVGEGTIVLDMPDGSTRAIGIERLHLEQDAGKLIHDMRPSQSLVDLNRAGVALMEIVSKPDLRSPEEAGMYLRKLRAILRYLGTCDGNMEEGSMRCDANVSVRPVGSNELRTRCEIKNVNSVRFVMQAIEHEARRHVEVYEGGGKIDQETRLYDPNRGETRPMRSKEFAHDYRYFPDPDLMPLTFGEDFVNAIRAKLPELPDDKKARFIQDYDLTPYDAAVIVAEKEVAAAADAAATEALQKGGKAAAKLAVSFYINNVSGALNKANIDVAASPVTPHHVAGLSLMVQVFQTVSRNVANTAIAGTISVGHGDPIKWIENEGLLLIRDDAAIEAAVDKVIAENAAKAAEVRAGKEALMNWFVGQVMRATKGKAKPDLVAELLKKKLSS